MTDREPTILLRVSVMDLLSLWSELEQALHGTNGFGGDTAEIYFYRFGLETVTLYMAPQGSSLHAEETQRVGTANARALYELLALFHEHRCDGHEIYVDATRHHDGKVFGPWILAEQFHHRVHIRIKARA